MPIIKYHPITFFSNFIFDLVFSIITDANFQQDQAKCFRLKLSAI